MAGARSSELHGCKQSSLPLAGTPSSAYVLIEDRDQQQCATSTPLKAIELQQTGCSKGDAEAVGSTEPTPDCEEGKPLLSDPSVCSGVIQKLNYRILPIFMVMSMLNYIDRTNTAFASLQMNRDLQLSAETYGLGSGLFFIGYSVFQIPSQFILMKVGAPRWLSCIVILWGVTAMMFSLITNRVQFCVLRVLLGAFESGSWPGMWYYLSCFYPHDSITVPYSLLEASAGLANIVGSPMAAGLLMLDGTGGWAGWRWLYLMEGLPSVCLGAAMWFILPRNFQSASFLTQADKAWLTREHASSNNHQQSRQDRESLEPSRSSNPCRLLQLAASNHRVWICSLISFLKNAGYIGLLFWVPLIIHSILQGVDVKDGQALQPSGGHGHRNLVESADAVIRKTPIKGYGSNSTNTLPQIPGQQKGVTAALLTAIPYGAAVSAAVALGHSSQRLRDKCRHIAGPYSIAALLLILFPYIMLLGKVATFVCLTLAFAALTAPNPVLNSLASSVGFGPSLALSLALYNAVGNLGGLVGPWLIGKVVQMTELYAAALQVLGVILGLAAGLCWWLHRQWRL